MEMMEGASRLPPQLPPLHPEDSRVPQLFFVRLPRTPSPLAVRGFIHTDPRWPVTFPRPLLASAM